MGNQVPGQGSINRIKETFTPKKKNSTNLFSNIFAQNQIQNSNKNQNQNQSINLNSNEKKKSKSSTKEGLYAEDKIFENYESNIK